jgi:hypothetical protein
MSSYFSRVGSFLNQALPKRDAGGQQKGWNRIPHIEQQAPRGESRRYEDGARYCAPAVVAMLARGAGLDRRNDAQLIRGLAEGLVHRDGASPQGVVKMLERVNLPLAGPALPARYSDAELQQHLSQGTKLIAQVQSSDRKTGRESAHYVLVRSMTPQGNYVISDPLKPKPYEVSPQKLRQLVSRAPPDGGLLIPVAQPGSSPQPSTAPGAGTAGPTGSGLDEAFGRMEAGHRRQASKASMGFMARNEARNNFALEIDYIQGAAPRSNLNAPIVPSNANPDRFARELRDLKRKGNPRAYELLEQLQASPFPQDQQMAERIMRADLKQPGIGKKLLGDPA